MARFFLVRQGTSIRLACLAFCISQTCYRYQANPQQNAYIERYNRTVRYDWLSHYLFESIEEVQHYATEWM